LYYVNQWENRVPNNDKPFYGKQKIEVHLADGRDVRAARIPIND
jgi:hypothetical protein